MLRAASADDKRLLHLPCAGASDCAHQVYLVRPHVRLMKYIANHIHSARKRDSKGKKFRLVTAGSPSLCPRKLPALNDLLAGLLLAPSSCSIYFVPRRTMLCERVLAEEGVFGTSFP